MDKQNEWKIVFDGGSRGNPGHGYGSYVLMKGEEVVIREALDYADRGPKVTNNEAEYLTLINALDRLKEVAGANAKSTKVKVFGDSLLVISQLKGVWKVKTESLRPYHTRAAELVKHFGSVELTWHARSNSVTLLGH